MAIILSTLNAKKKKGRTKYIGSFFNVLLLYTGISKDVIERVAEEKNLSKERAEDFVIECIRDGVKTVKTKSRF